jgi:hypothetical protein
MTEVFIIPNGEHLAYYRQFGKLNRIEPIKMKDGNWCLPTRVLPMLQKTYVDIDPKSKRFKKRKDVNLSTIRYASDTIEELKVYPKRQITKEDIDSKYFDKDGVNGKKDIWQRLGLKP